MPLRVHCLERIGANVSNTLWLLDLDRTLLKTEELIGRYIDAVKHVTGDEALVQSMNERWHAVESVGQPYGFTEQLRETMDDYQVTALDHYVASHSTPDDLLEPGATELLNTLARLNLPHGVMTYGPPDRQLFKLRVTNLDKLPYIITDTPIKATVIEGWKDSTGFTTPATLLGDEEHFEHIALVDDKAVAFQNLPAGMKGFVYRSGDMPLLKSQAGDTPEGVVILHKLQDLIAFLEN